MICSLKLGPFADYHQHTNMRITSFPLSWGKHSFHLFPLVLCILLKFRLVFAGCDCHAFGPAAGCALQFTHATCIISVIRNDGNVNTRAGNHPWKAENHQSAHFRHKFSCSCYINTFCPSYRWAGHLLPSFLVNVSGFMVSCGR